MKVKLSPYPHHLGIKTEVDGVEMPEVTHIALDCSVDGLPRLTVTMQACDLDVELDAEVVILLQVHQDEEVEIDEIGTKKRIRTVAR